MALVDDVIANATAKLGASYVLGTEGPTTFDCSGLMWWIFNQESAGALIGGSRRRAAGYTRWAADNGQFTRDFRRAERGDLLVYEHPVGHVGIYLGGGDIISALIPPYGVKRTKYNHISVPFYGVILVDYGAGRTSTDDAPDTTGTEVDTIFAFDGPWDAESVLSNHGRALWHIEFEDRPRRAMGTPDVVNKITRRRPGPPPEATTEPDATIALTPYTSEEEFGSPYYDGGFSGWDRVDPDYSFAVVLSGHSADLKAGVYHALAYPFTDCGVDAFTKGGRFVSEVWFAFTASWADNEIGATFALDTSALTATGLAVGSPVTIGVASATPSATGQFTPIGSVVVGASGSVFLPRSVLPAGTNYVVIAPGWAGGVPYDIVLCGGQHVGGEIDSLVPSTWDNPGADNPWTLTTQILSGTGLTPWVPGDGDVDGTNATFTLLEWNGKGVPEVRVGDSVLSGGEYTYDTGALTVTLTAPPPADMAGQVAFRYQI